MSLGTCKSIQKGKCFIKRVSKIKKVDFRKNEIVIYMALENYTMKILLS